MSWVKLDQVVLVIVVSLWLYIIYRLPWPVEEVLWSHQLPTLPPAKSLFADFQWPPLINVTAEEVHTYEDDGFVVLQQVLDHALIDILHSAAERVCAHQMGARGACQYAQGRWQDDVLRDFLLYGPIGDLAHQFIQGSGVRVVNDGFFGVQHRKKEIWFSSFFPHVDHGGVPGIFSGLNSYNRGVSVWMPLQEIDANTTGGSIFVYRNFSRGPCLRKFGVRNTLPHNDSLPRMALPDFNQISSDCTDRNLSKQEVTLSFKKGDVLVWHPNMLHRTQPVLKPEFTRYAWYARFVNSDSVYCYPHMCDIKTRPCCAGDLPLSGDTIHTPCYPQVFPSMLEHEVAAHLGDQPAPLMSRSSSGWSVKDIAIAGTCYEPQNEDYAKKAHEAADAETQKAQDSDEQNPATENNQ